MTVNGFPRMVNTSEYLQECEANGGSDGVCNEVTEPLKPSERRDLNALDDALYRLYLQTRCQQARNEGIAHGSRVTNALVFGAFVVGVLFGVSLPMVALSW